MKKLSDIPNTIEKEDGTEIELTYGERRIIKKLFELEELWLKHGENLTLLNGQDLLYMKGINRAPCYSDTIQSFRIRGEGGDPDRHPKH